MVAFTESDLIGSLDERFQLWTDSAMRSCQQSLIEGIEFGCAALRLSLKHDLRDDAWRSKLQSLMNGHLDTWIQAFPSSVPTMVLKALNPFVEPLSGRQYRGHRAAGCDNSDHTAFFRAACLIRMAGQLFEAGADQWISAIALKSELDDAVGAASADAADSDEQEDGEDSDDDDAVAERTPDDPACRHRAQQQPQDGSIAKATIQASVKCLSILAHAERFLQEADSVMDFKDNSDTNEAALACKPVRRALQEMRDSVELQKCVCASVRERINAEHLLAWCQRRMARLARRRYRYRGRARKPKPMPIDLVLRVQSFFIFQVASIFTTR